MKYFFKCILSTGLLAISGFLTFGANIYVNTTGNCGAGTPCYPTIQSAIDGAVDGDIIYIQPGVYEENIIVNKSVRLIGTGTNRKLIEILPRLSDVGSVFSNSADIGIASDIITILSPNVSISNLTIDGSNPFISVNEALVNNVMIDARNGIVNERSSGMVINNVTIRNIFGRGVQIGDGITFSDGHQISNTGFLNVQGNEASKGLAINLTDVDISSCQFINPGHDNGASGISLYKGKANINTCLFNGMGFFADFSEVICSYSDFSNTVTAIQCHHASYAEINDNFINESFVHNSVGIYVSQVYGDHLIFYNTIRNAEMGIMVGGSDNTSVVTLSDNNIDGNYLLQGSASAVGIYTTNKLPIEFLGSQTNVNALSGVIKNVLIGVIIEASEIDAAGNSFSGNYTNTTALGNTQLKSVAKNYIQLQTEGANTHIPNINASAVVFDNLSNLVQAHGFSIEDKIFHKMDESSLGSLINEGLVIFSPDKLFITGNQGNSSIQRGVNNALADGWVLNVKDGYNHGSTEDIQIDKSITVDGDNDITLYGLAMNATGKTLDLARPVTIQSDLKLTGGLIDNGINTLSLLNSATVTGGSDDSFVMGKVSKTGNSAFTFPVGGNGKYRPCSISVPTNVTDQFEAIYQGISPRATITPSAINSPGSPAMLLVSDREYWEVKQTLGSSTVNIGLNWRDISASGDKNNDADLVVAVYNGSGWNNIGGTTVNAGGLVWVTSSIASPGYDRFSVGSTSLLTSLSAAALPIVVGDFKATKRNQNEAILTWKTYSESNSKEFRIERSANGIDFTRIGTLPATGFSNNLKPYSYTDFHPAFGIQYYRLKLVDLDDKFTYSKINTLRFEETGHDIITSSRDTRQVMITIADYKPSNNYQVVIWDLNGTKVVERKLNSAFSTISSDHLSHGIYVINLFDQQKGTVQTWKLAL